MYAIYSELHELHAPTEVNRRGVATKYMECPDRAAHLLAALDAGDHTMVAPREFTLDEIYAVHDRLYVDFLRTAHERWQSAFLKGGAGEYASAHTFASRHHAVCPTSIQGQVGYYLSGSSVPVTSGTYKAAVAAAFCALEAAALLREGQFEAYALCRPPGHHAYRDLGGGFCYLNNAAIAAQSLLGKHERVAIFDFDVHHGNGTQSIFYDRDDVHFVSVHADPNDVYPFYSGHADECGVGAGEGHNLNLTVPVASGDEVYLEAVTGGLDSVSGCGATALVVSAGFDAYRDDPSVQMNVSTEGFREIGRQIGRLRLPTALIQEGGYLVGDLGTNLAAFLDGFASER